MKVNIYIHGTGRGYQIFPACDEKETVGAYLSSLDRIKESSDVLYKFIYKRFDRSTFAYTFFKPNIRDFLNRDGGNFGFTIVLYSAYANAIELCNMMKKFFEEKVIGTCIEKGSVMLRQFSDPSEHNKLVEVQGFFIEELKKLNFFNTDSTYNYQANKGKEVGKNEEIPSDVDKEFLEYERYEITFVNKIVEDVQDPEQGGDEKEGENEKPKDTITEKEIKKLVEEEVERRLKLEIERLKKDVTEELQKSQQDEIDSIKKSLDELKKRIDEGGVGGDKKTSWWERFKLWFFGKGGNSNPNTENSTLDNNGGKDEKESNSKTKKKVNKGHKKKRRN